MFAQAPGYSTFADTEKRIAALARQHPDAVRVSAMGKSAGGRTIHAIEIAGKGAVAPGMRPAIFVGANIAGFHNAGTEAALRLADRLVLRKGEPLLQTRTFYIVPCLNPDAADALFAKVRWRNSLNGARLDRDRDGLVGEDGPNDLNGDGRITQMRIPDPHGEWMVDPADARLMKKADPAKGEKGTHRLVTEGGDDDGDGAFNEDPAGGFPPDKNFAHAWADNDPEAGPFASSTPEAKAVMDYLLARRNVAAAFVFGSANNLLELPKSAPAAPAPPPPGPPAAGGPPPAVQPSTAVDADDLKFYQSLADEYKKALEKAAFDAKRPGKASTGGSLQNWLYYHYATFAVELDVWGLAKPMEFVDKSAKDAFAAWTPVTLTGGVKAEVGGLDPFAEIAPPAAELARAADLHADLVIGAAEKLAKVEVLSFEAKPLGAGVWRVTAIAGNTGAWPTHTKQAVRAKTFLPVRLKLTLPNGSSRVSGGDQAFSERLTGGTGTLKGEWVVRSAAGARLVVEALTQSAGADRKELTIQ